MRNSRKRRLRYANEASMLCLSILSAISAIITCIAAVLGYARLGWLVCITLMLLFLSAVNRLRIRAAFKTLHNAHAVRRAARHDKGKIVEFKKKDEDHEA